MNGLENIVGGIIAGIVATLIYETFRKPNISIKAVNDEWNPESEIHTLHVSIENKTRRYKVFPTREAVDCSGRIMIYDQHFKPIKINDESGEFTLKWRGLNKEQLTIYPGSEQWPGAKGKHLDVFSKRRGETKCKIEEVNPQRRKELPEGIYYIKLVIYYAGGRKEKWFRLSNLGRLPEEVINEEDKHPKALKLEEVKIKIHSHTQNDILNVISKFALFFANLINLPQSLRRLRP